MSSGGGHGTNSLIEEEISQNNAELSAKRDQLYQERLGIVKASGAQQWNPTPLDPGSPAPKPAPFQPHWHPWW